MSPRKSKGTNVVKKMLPQPDMPINIGTSAPLSGPYAVFSTIQDGMRARLDAGDVFDQAGALLQGVKFRGPVITTETVIYRSLNGTVRPVIAYCFFMLYAAVKFLSYAAIAHADAVPFVVLHDTLWTEDDSAIFAGIISFYFGQRAMSKLRSGK